MNCKFECAYLSIIIGIISGVILGVLYSLGFVSTGIIFWVYLAIGVSGVLLSPIYASKGSCQGLDKCFCNYRKILLTAASGTIITAAAGLIVSALTSTIATAVVLGLATFFTVMFIVSVICLASCLCN